jgi:polysaccharide export outer membrane protein
MLSIRPVFRAMIPSSVMSSMSRFALPLLGIWLSSSLSSLSLSVMPSLAQAPSTVSTTSAPGASPALPPESEYILGPGDRLSLSIYQVADVNGEFQVSVDGSLGLPLIGAIKVEGKTIPQLTSLLQQRYQKYIKRPEITLVLRQPRPLNITVVGEVNAPGAYKLASEQGQKFPTVTDLIQQAKGLTPVADISQVELRRNTGNGESRFQVNLLALLQDGDTRQNASLRDGDVLVIPSKVNNDPQVVRQLVDANFGIRYDTEINVAIVGQVFRSGAYKLKPTSASDAGTRQPVRLTQALQEAGGVKPDANIRDIQIRRQNRNGQEQLITVNLWDLLEQGNLEKDVILQSGDTIAVPQAKELTATQFDAMATANFSPKTIRVNVIGEVKRSGMVELPPNSTLNQGILAAGGFDPRRADQSNVNLIRLNPDGTVTKLAIQPDFGENINPQNNPTLRNNDVILVNTNALASTTDTLGTVFSPLGAILGGGFLSIFNLLN